MILVLDNETHHKYFPLTTGTYSKTTGLLKVSKLPCRNILKHLKVTHIFVRDTAEFDEELSDLNDECYGNVKPIINTFSNGAGSNYNRGTFYVNLPKIVEQIKKKGNIQFELRNHLSNTLVNWVGDKDKGYLYEVYKQGDFVEYKLFED